MTLGITIIGIIFVATLSGFLLGYWWDHMRDRDDS